MKKTIRYSVTLNIILIFLYNSPALNAQDDLTEEYEKIYLERQPPEKIMALLEVKRGMTIGEVGAGRGRMTVYFSREVGPSGKIYANDIDEMSLAYLKGRCRRLGLNNVELIKGEMDDPLLPVRSLDMAVMVLVFHMLENPDKLLENIKKSLRPDARLVIIDPVNEEIDREFGIDRSKPDIKAPTIIERIGKSAKTTGYEFIVNRSYPEAVAVLSMGLELYPQSSMLYAEMGEAYFFEGDRIKSKDCWKKAFDLDPGNSNGKFLLENFDALFNQVHQGKNEK